MLFPARAAFVVNYSFKEIGRCFRTFESGFRWRLFWDLNPVSFFITLPCFCTVSVSTTNSTKSHFKAHFSLSFATVSRAVVSLYFKCALKCDIAFSLSHRLASFVITAISHTHWFRAFNLQLAIFTNGISRVCFYPNCLKLKTG